MINASALQPVIIEPLKVIEILSQGNRNYKIEYSQGADSVPEAVEELSYRMLLMDSDLKGIINGLRVLYDNNIEGFHFDLRTFSKESKGSIVRLFKDMYGIVTEVFYNDECDTLIGKISLNPRAHKFIDGQYMEIGIKKVVHNVLTRLGKLYNKKFNLYSNVIIFDEKRIAKNEFDLIIENESDGIIYFLEVKTEKGFRDSDKLEKMGKEYGIAPNRLFLVDNHKSAKIVEQLEYFSGYHWANLDNNLENKIAAMLENDL